MRILMLTTFFHPDKFGGAERVVYDLARHLVQGGAAVTVLTRRAEGTAEEETIEGVRVRRYPAARPGTPAFYPSVFRGVRRALAGLRREGAAFDLLHTHQVLSAFSALFPRPALPIPRVASFYAPYHQEFESKHLEGRPAAEAGRPPRGWASPAARLLRRADRKVLAAASAVIVLSRFSRGQVEALLGPRPAPAVHVIPAGVDLARFRPAGDAGEKAALRARLDLPRETPVLFCVRRHVARMGLEDLVDAAALLAERGVPFLLAVGGTGPRTPALEARAAASAARDRIRFTGALSEAELPAWYRSADLFVLPTRSLEGFGMVTVEAFASGLPVAGTRAGATEELLEDLDPGLLFPPGDPASMADRIQALLADPARLADLGRTARRLAEERYAWPVAAERTRAVYEAVLRGKGDG